MSCKKDNQGSEYQKPTIPFPFAIEGQIGTFDNSSIMSDDGNFIICGNKNEQVLIIKVSKFGKAEWAEDYNINSSSSASGIAETVNKELFVCGKSEKSQSNLKEDVLLIKFNSSGDTLWTKNFGGEENDFATNIIYTSDGNLLLSGKTQSFGAGISGDIYILKINTDGDTLWTKTYPDPEQESPYHVLESQNGGFLITGLREYNGIPKEIYLLRIDNDGNQQWSKTIGPPTYKWAYSTIELFNGDLILCGGHGTGGKILVLKTDPLGNVLWEKEYGLNNVQGGYSIKQNLDSSFTICGTSYDIASDKSDNLLLKLDQNGNQLWLKELHLSTNVGAYNLMKDVNDDNIITGNYDDHIYITRTNKDGVEY